MRNRMCSATVMQSVMSQVALAVAHLHTGPGVCHLDVKPENYIVSDTLSDSTDVVVKLTDFDTALQPRLGKMCTNCVGTPPFVAPEVLLTTQYDPFAADTWSLSMVLLELQCGSY